MDVVLSNVCITECVWEVKEKSVRYRATWGRASGPVSSSTARRSGRFSPCSEGQTWSLIHLHERRDLWASPAVLGHHCSQRQLVLAWSRERWRGRASGGRNQTRGKWRWGGGANSEFRTLSFITSHFFYYLSCHNFAHRLDECNQQCTFFLNAVIFTTLHLVNHYISFLEFIAHFVLHCKVQQKQQYCEIFLLIKITVFYLNIIYSSDFKAVFLHHYSSHVILQKSFWFAAQKSFIIIIIMCKTTWV